MESQANSARGDLLQGRFVVLRHECGPANGGPAAIHWDLLLELPGYAQLPTWQIASPPESWPTAGTLPAWRIADHRTIYMTYEGPISRDRGTVTRVESGAARVHIGPGTEWEILLQGAQVSAHLRLPALMETRRSPRKGEEHEGG